MIRRKLKCFDVCCGAGVFSLGFHKAGFEILGGIDIDPHAIETARHNLPHADWRKTSMQDLAKQISQNKTHPIYGANVIIAGLPCQGFSVAGKCEPEDERNTLYKILFKIIDKVKPEFVIVENVQGLMLERNRETFEKIISGFERRSYEVDYRVYDAANLGTPQHRRRVFIVASSSISPTKVFDAVRFTSTHITVRKALAALPQKRQVKNRDHTFMVHSKAVMRKIGRIHGATVISYRRLSFDKPSLTIVSGHNALPVHPTENRAISIREAARLQGIPDKFRIKGPRTEQTVQIANAVPFPMAFRIGKAIISARRSNGQNGKLFDRLSDKLDDSMVIEMRKGFKRFYLKHGKNFPWRHTVNPHKILLTELLLQRTKGEMVNGQWKEILQATELTNDGFKIDKATLRKAVQRIGIFSRVKSIQNTFSKLHQYFKNSVPRHFDELLNIPGVGIYMASAVRTFAHNIPDFPVDSNGFRFIRRFFGENIIGKKSEARQIRNFMNAIIDQKKPREFVYGFLDFCSLVCKPSGPSCSDCFLKSQCVQGKRLSMVVEH